MKKESRAMTIRNNNSGMIKRLAQAEYRSNKSRNRLMMLAVAMTVIVIFCIFTVMKGRIDAEYLMEVREEGSASNTSLENPTQAQIEQIKNLPYVKNVGLINSFASAGVDGKMQFVCTVADESAYEDMYVPAFSDIEGSYPEKENELMLSIRGLQEIGITEPALGMEISIGIVLDSDDIRYKTFILSGYYTDYVHPVISPPIGFFSESYLNELGFSMEKPTRLLIQQKDYLTGETVEQRLYKDVETRDDVQRFESEDSVNYNVIVRTIGGYDIAGMGILLIFVCVFFLNYNVMNISVNRDMQYYGMLKTLGTTNRQIRAVLYRQIMKIALLGCIIGSLISSFIVVILLPRILSHYYLNNYGVSSDMMKFHGSLLVFSILCAILTALVSVLIPAVRAGRIAPVESVKYIGKTGNTRKFAKCRKQGKEIQEDTQLQQKMCVRQIEYMNQSVQLQQDADTSHHVHTKQGKYKRHRKNSMAHMAWRNILRNRHSLFLSILSLFIGLTAALSSVLVTRGLDYTNNFKLFPDFTLISVYNPMTEDYDDSYQAVTQKEIDYFSSIDGVKDVQTQYGNYLYLSADEPLWEPYLKGYENAYTTGGEKYRQEMMENVKNNFCAIVFLADQDFISELEDYVAQNDINLDMESFLKGEAAICVDKDMYSQKLSQRSDEFIGDSFTIADTRKNSLGQMKFAGNLDVTTKTSPKLQRIIHLYGPDIIMTEEAFERLGITRIPMNVDVYVTADREPQIKRSFNQYMEKKRQQIPPSEQDEKLPFLNINSDNLAAAQDEIKTMQTAMYAVSILLILLGIFNYLNTVVVGLWARRREIAMMEAIGITRRQLRQMLVWEGLYYSLIITALLTTAGSAALYGVYKIVHSRLGYARFYFPYIPLAGIILVMILVCVGVPLFIYRKIASESVIERLRLSRE